jgi:hypothetical protein
MSSISSTGSSILQSTGTPGGNWVQDTLNATADSADWMDPNASSGPSATEAAANAFAAAHQVALTNQNSLAVNTGISLLSTQLAGQTVNLLA